MSRLTLLLAVLLVALAAQPHAQQPTDVQDRKSYRVVQFSPPPSYQKWWYEVIACGGFYHKPALSQRVTKFYRVESPSFVSGGHDAIGSFVFLTRAIYLAKPYVDEEWVVKHEMMHALLFPSGIIWHSDEFFRGRCGGLMWDSPDRPK